MTVIMSYEDRAIVDVDGEEVEVFNHVTVEQSHYIRANESLAHEPRVLAGDGGIGEPDAVTRDIAEQLEDELRIDLSETDIDVIDTEDVEVTVR